MEAFGIFRQFNDRIIYPFGTAAFPFGTPFQNHNNQTVGDGVGGSILVPIVPKVLQVQFSGMTGWGIGRYGASQLPDVTFNSDGSLAPIQETMLLAGLTWPAIPGLDFYTYAGQEAQNPKFGTAFGWGNPCARSAKRNGLPKGGHFTFHPSNRAWLDDEPGSTA